MKIDDKDADLLFVEMVIFQFATLVITRGKDHVVVISFRKSVDRNISCQFSPQL